MWEQITRIFRSGLLMDGVIDRAIAMDVIEGPLEKARGNIELYGVSDKVELQDLRRS